MRAMLRAIIRVSTCVGSACGASGAQSALELAPAATRRPWFAAMVILSLSMPVVHASCRLEEASEFHVDLVDGSPIIDGEINGQPIRILLETGAHVGYISRTGARQLNLHVGTVLERGQLGSNGYKSKIEITELKEFKLGTIVLKNYTTKVASDVIHDAHAAVIYQLGADVLTQFTTEWDLAHGVVRFLHPQGCQLEQLAYWSPGYFKVNLEPVTSLHWRLELEIKINDKPMKAELVSGSANSYISPEGAREAGVDPGGPDAKPARDITGLSAKPIPTWIGRFDTIEVGGETIRNARLLIAELSPTQLEWSGALIPHGESTAKIYLGADFLRANHVIIVPEKQAALFTYVGGAVFQLERPQ